MMISSTTSGIAVDPGAAPAVIDDDMIESPLGGLLYAVSGFGKARRICLLMALKLERNWFYSRTARRIMEHRYGVKIGAYSYGGCFVPGVFPEGTLIGRYVSIAHGANVLRRNHPLNWISTHPFFFNHKLGFVATDHAPYRPLVIEHDAWIGERVTITPGCGRIGIGSVVGASAVVTRDVPDYSVVGGNPAKIIKFRFAEKERDELIRSRWWEKSMKTLAKNISTMARPYPA